LQFSDKDERHRGEYKKFPIQIEAFDEAGKSLGVVFTTTSPLETPMKMQELVQWTNGALETKSLHPLLVIGIFVVVFLAIHPFQDGNGRPSRLLTTLLMLKTGYSYVPYSSMESIIETNKESYYLALQKTQKSWQNGKPDWAPWLLFFLQCLQRQKEHLRVKLSREKMLMEQFSPLHQTILDLLKAHGRLKISAIQALTDTNRNTLKKAMALLVKNRQVVLHGRGRSAWYSY
jgi:Fic family protein